MNKKEKEPQWIKDAAKSMLSSRPTSYGDEDQNDLMEEIDSKDHEFDDEEE